MFNIDNYNKLVESSSDSLPLISIYIPTYRSGKSQEDNLRFKNAISDAAEQLMNKEILGDQVMNKQDASKYLVQCYDLLDNENFWNELSDGLAVFVGPDIFEYYTVPIDFHPYVYVDSCFHLRHIIPRNEILKF